MGRSYSFVFCPPGIRRSLTRRTRMACHLPPVSIAAEVMRTTADRVADPMAAADIMHEQTEQLVVDLCRQSDLMAQQVENFFGRWVKLVTLCKLATLMSYGIG